MRRRGRVAAALALVAFGLWARAGLANPMDAFGYGARAAAMGGAHVGAADDGSANYYNPAILAGFDAIRIDLGYQYAAPKLAINGRDSQIDSSRGLVVSGAVPGRVGPFPIAVGIGTYFPDHHLTRTRTYVKDQPRFAVFDNRPQRMLLTANMALAITDRVLIGGGVGYLSGAKGDVIFDGRVGFPNHLDSELDLDISVDLKTTRYPRFGLLVHATDRLDIGFSYRGGFVVGVRLGMLISGDVGPDGVPPAVADGFFGLDTRYRALFQPEQYTLGLGARLPRDVVLAFDLVYQRWSEFENPASRFEIDYDLGSLDVLVEIPPREPLPDPGFHDILIPRLGIEWTARRTDRSTLTARAGYSFEQTPTPMQNGDTNFVDNDKHTLSLGLGLDLTNLTEILPRPVSIDFYAATTWLPEREHRKLSAVDRIGDYRAGGHLLQAGVCSRWRF